MGLGERRLSATGLIVRRYEPDITDDRWGAGVLARHGALVRRLRRRFEPAGGARGSTSSVMATRLDLTACVRALVDQRSGPTVDDRLYVAGARLGEASRSRCSSISAVRPMSGSTHAAV
jgi:hypothetical protein